MFLFRVQVADDEYEGLYMVVVEHSFDSGDSVVKIVMFRTFADNNLYAIDMQL